MPDWMTRLFPGASEKETPRRVEGFKADGAVVVRDSRGTARAEIPSAYAKSETLGDDPLAIYKPTGAKHVDAAKAMGNFSGWVYAAVNAIASEVANIQWRLYEITDKDHEEKDDHPLLDLLDGVNDHMTGIELKYVTVAHLELTGNFYWLLDGVKSDTDKPTAIYPLNPGRVCVKLDKSQFPYKLSHYEFTIDGKVFKFQPYQILHGKYPDPGDPYVGVGVPQTIPTWIDSDNYAMEYNRKFFINGAAIGLYIATDTNVEGNIERIRQGFADRYSGTENAHKTPVLPKGAKLEHTGTTQRDMDFANLTNVTRDRILAGFRVSKTILGTAESDTNRSTAETADYVFSKRTIKPKMLLVLSYLNEFLVPRYGDNLYLTFIDPVPEDKAARTDEMEKAVASMPIMTQNEARKNYLGLGPIDGGDKLMAPVAFAEVGSTEQPEGESSAPQLAKAMTVAGRYAKSMRIRTGGKSAYSGNRKMRSALVDAFKKAIESKAEPAYEFKRVSDMTKEEYMEHYKRFDARTRKAEKELVRVFEGVNRKQREEVIANLPKATGQKALGDLFDPKEWMAITVDLATPVLDALTKDEAAAALAMVGAAAVDILASAGTRAALDAGIAKMAKSYTDTTLSQLKEAIGEKLTQEGGTNLAELTQAVDDTYAFADARRAGLIAKTESYRTANWANREAWQQSGVVSTLVWYTAEDDHVCAECADIDGKEVGFEDKFFNDTYSGGEAPPLHPDCRCYIRPGEVSIE